jgi:hypothetical protein
MVADRRLRRYHALNLERSKSATPLLMSTIYYGTLNVNTGALKGYSAANQRLDRPDQGRVMEKFCPAIARSDPFGAVFVLLCCCSWPARFSAWCNR